MRQLKLGTAAAVAALGSILCFAALAHAGPVPCDAQAARFAWASPNAAAFAWASQPTADCHCKPSCNCSPCACAETPCRLYWVSLGNGEWRLIEAGKCNGTSCTKDKVIGGWNGDYRSWDGKRWGPIAAPPIAPPATPVLKQTNRWTLSDVATALTAALVGLVDDCPGGVCPAKQPGSVNACQHCGGAGFQVNPATGLPTVRCPVCQGTGKAPPTAFSGVSVKGHDAVPKHAVAEGPRRKAKRVVAAPFRMVKHTRHAFHARMHVRRGR